MQSVNVLEEANYKDIFEKAVEKKREGFRLSQACAAYVKGKPELSYSFANDDSYEFVTYRISLEDKNTEIISISDVFPYAFFYENEMKELFGINISHIEPDYQNKLYRIRTETPFVPKN